MTVNSPVIPITLHHIERLCQIVPFEKQMNEGIVVWLHLHVKILFLRCYAKVEGVLQESTSVV